MEATEIVSRLVKVYGAAAPMKRGARSWQVQSDHMASGVVLADDTVVPTSTAPVNSALAAHWARAQQHTARWTFEGEEAARLVELLQRVVRMAKLGAGPYWTREEAPDHWVKLDPATGTLSFDLGSMAGQDRVHAFPYQGHAIEIDPRRLLALLPRASECTGLVVRLSWDDASTVMAIRWGVTAHVLAARTGTGAQVPMKPVKPARPPRKTLPSTEAEVTALPLVYRHQDKSPCQALHLVKRHPGGRGGVLARWTGDKVQIVRVPPYSRALHDVTCTRCPGTAFAQQHSARLDARAEQRAARETRRLERDAAWWAKQGTAASAE